MGELIHFLGDNALGHQLQQICLHYQILPLHADTTTLTVAASSPPASAQLAALRFASGLEVKVELWPTARLEQALHRANTDEHAHTTGALIPPRAQEEGNSDTQDAPAVQFIDRLLRQAIQRRASDIHLEPYQHSYRIRLRIDGVLQPISAPSAELAPRLTARLKIMGQLDIAERRRPQDGQLSFSHQQQHYALRIATLPTQFGEKVVLRLLPTAQQALTLEESGMSPSVLALFTRTLSSPQGLILVTGPTGSGKTITLYNAIHLLNDGARNICSVEDPIEIPLTGINQTQVNPKVGLDFALILRALLRQDPDVIMIGEIRDIETAEIAVKAAQTGHLVLSTLHTNSITETLTRLSQMGIPDYLLAASLRLIIAQRLVRRLCPHCRQPQHTSISDFPPTLWSGPLHRWQATGCQHCFSGYYGRIGLYELLAITPEMQQALSTQTLTQQRMQMVQSIGHHSLMTAGLALVDSGITSLEELYRVVGERDE